MDKYGHHALSCPGKGLMTKRHDAICDKFYDYCVMAKLDVEKEQRYKDDGNNGKIRIQGRPGDIKIKNYFTASTIPRNSNHRDLYVDFSIVNIFADTYINKASKYRGYWAKEREKLKIRNIITIQMLWEWV